MLFEEVHRRQARRSLRRLAPLAAVAPRWGDVVAADYDAGPTLSVRSDIERERVTRHGVDLRGTVVGVSAALADYRCEVGVRMVPACGALRFGVRQTGAIVKPVLAPLAAALAADVIDRHAATAGALLRQLFPDAPVQDVFPPAGRAAVGRLLRVGYNADRYVWRLAQLYVAAVYADALRIPLHTDAEDVPAAVPMVGPTAYGAFLAANDHNVVCVRHDGVDAELADVLGILALAATPDMALRVEGVEVPTVLRVSPALHGVVVTYMGHNIAMRGNIGVLGPRRVWGAAALWAQQHRVVDQLLDSVVEVMQLLYASHDEYVAVVEDVEARMTLPAAEMRACALTPLTLDPALLGADLPPEPVSDSQEALVAAAITTTGLAATYAEYVASFGLAVVGRLPHAQRLLGRWTQEASARTLAYAPLLHAAAALHEYGWNGALGWRVASLRPVHAAQHAVVPWIQNMRRRLDMSALVVVTGRVPAASALRWQLAPFAPRDDIVAGALYRPRDLDAAHSAAEVLAGLAAAAEATAALLHIRVRRVAALDGSSDHVAWPQAFDYAGTASPYGWFDTWISEMNEYHLVVGFDEAAAGARMRMFAERQASRTWYVDQWVDARRRVGIAADVQDPPFPSAPPIRYGWVDYPAGAGRGPAGPPGPGQAFGRWPGHIPPPEPRGGGGGGDNGGPDGRGPGGGHGARPDDRPGDGPDGADADDGDQWAPSPAGSDAGDPIDGAASAPPYAARDDRGAAEVERERRGASATAHARPSERSATFDVADGDIGRDTAYPPIAGAPQLAGNEPSVVAAQERSAAAPAPDEGVWSTARFDALIELGGGTRELGDIIAPLRSVLRSARATGAVIGHAEANNAVGQLHSRLQQLDLAAATAHVAPDNRAAWCSHMAAGIAAVVPRSSSASMAKSFADDAERFRAMATALRVSPWVTPAELQAQYERDQRDTQSRQRSVATANERRAAAGARPLPTPGPIGLAAIAPDAIGPWLERITPSVAVCMLQSRLPLTALTGGRVAERVDKRQAEGRLGMVAGRADVADPLAGIAREHIDNMVGAIADCPDVEEALVAFTAGLPGAAVTEIRRRVMEARAVTVAPVEAPTTTSVAQMAEPWRPRSRAGSTAAPEPVPATSPAAAVVAAEADGLATTHDGDTVAELRAAVAQDIEQTAGLHGDDGGGCDYPAAAGPDESVAGFGHAGSDTSPAPLSARSGSHSGRSAAMPDVADWEVELATAEEQEAANAAEAEYDAETERQRALMRTVHGPPPGIPTAITDRDRRRGYVQVATPGARGPITTLQMLGRWNREQHRGVFTPEGRPLTRSERNTVRRYDHQQTLPRSERDCMLARDARALTIANPEARAAAAVTGVPDLMCVRPAARVTEVRNAAARKARRQAYARAAAAAPPRPGSGPT